MPQMKLVARIDADRPVAGIRGHEPGAPLFEPYALYGKLAVDVAYGDAAVAGCDRTVHDEQVAVADAVAGHAVARNPYEEGRGGIVDQFAVEVER